MSDRMFSGLPGPRDAAGLFSHALPGRARGALAGLLIALACAMPARHAVAAEPSPVATAVAEFDNLDSSGEAADRSAAHAARVEDFAGLLRETLAADAKFEIVQLTCPAGSCSARHLQPAKLLQTARDDGARLLVYGGVHKMSTLVQFAYVEAIDLKTNSSVFKQMISFRGDTDDAFQHAADFVTDYLKKVSFEP